MIDFNKFTQQAQSAIMASQEIMSRYQNNQLTPEHLLLAIIEDEKGLARKIFLKLEADISVIKEQAENAVAKKPKVMYSIDPNQLFISIDFKKLVDNAQEEANRLKDSYISIEHLLLAMASERNQDAGRMEPRQD